MLSAAQLEQPILGHEADDGKRLTLAEMYTVQELLGEGSYGRVFSASKVDNPDLCVALKVLQKQSSEETSLTTKVQYDHEVHILSKTSSNHHTPLLACHETASMYIIAMPYIPFCLGDLPDQFAPFLLDEQQMKLMYAHILEGVRYLLEEMRFVHQDIKPDNLLLSDDGYVKLSDFGTALSIKDAFSATFQGTMAYYSRAKLDGKAGSAPYADVVSASLSMVEIIEGELPYPVSDDPVVMSKTLHEFDFSQLTFKRTAWDASQLHAAIKHVLTDQKVSVFKALENAKFGQVLPPLQLPNSTSFELVDKVDKVDNDTASSPTHPQAEPASIDLVLPFRGTPEHITVRRNKKGPVTPKVAQQPAKKAKLLGDRNSVQ